MKVLCLDPSTAATGWAFFENGEVVLAGYFPLADAKLHGDKYVEATEWLKNMILLLSPDVIVMEDFFFSRRFASGSPVNVELRGVFKMTIRVFNIPYEIISPSDWKKGLMGRVRPTKEEIKKYGKSEAKKVITINHLKKIGVKIPKKIINPNTGREIDFKDDVSDALGILIYFLNKNGIQFKIRKDLWNFDLGKEEK